MKEIFLAYAKNGAMTKEELASVLKVKPDMVRRMAKSGKIPRLPGMYQLRFDPLAMIHVFCAIGPKEPSRSLTIERRKTQAKQNKEFRKCL
jgi:hypothetical protein